METIIGNRYYMVDKNTTILKPDMIAGRLDRRHNIWDFVAELEPSDLAELEQHYINWENKNSGK